MTSARNITRIAAALALLAAATVLLFGRGSVGPADALGQVADRTAGITSGVAHVKVVQGLSAADVITRWDGEDAAVVVDQQGLGGGAEHLELRLVDGTLYKRTGDGAWSSQPYNRADTGLEALQVTSSTQGLADAVRAASDVTVQGDTYSATVPAPATDPLQNVLGLGDPEGPVAVEVTESADGLIAGMSVATPTGTHELAYSQLGEPQAITAPQ